MIPGRSRRLLIPGLMTIVMLATLLGLGTWQVNRLVWKQGLIAAIASAEQHQPVPLTATPAAFARVRAEGEFDPVVAFYGIEVRTEAGAAIGGARLLGVLRREDAPPLLVDRGWVPLPPPAIPAGPATIEGYIRLPDHAGWLALTDDVAGRRFYTLDPARIGEALGIAGLAPYTLVAMAPANAPPTVPDPARFLPRPVNNHLSYAITWYGLALALLAVFALHARKALRP